MPDQRFILMVVFFQRHISNWMDGTEGMTDAEYRVYDVVCNLIYLNDGPIVLHEAGIAGRCNQHVLTFRKNFRTLVETGKLVIEGGKISNKRASSELVKIQSRRRKLPADPQATPASPSPDDTEVAVGSARGSADNPLKNKGTTSTDVGKLPSSLLFSPTAGVSESLFKLESTEDKNLRQWDFDEFWKPYPNKVGKDAARAAFVRVQKSNRVTFADLMAAWRRYIAKTDDRPWCNPATWLNQGRWEDQPATNGGRNGIDRNGGIASNHSRQGFASIALKRAREASETGR